MKKVIAFVGSARKMNTSKAAGQSMNNLNAPYGRKEKTMKRLICSTLIVMVAIVLSACANETSQSNTAVADVFTPAPQVSESTPFQAGVDDTAEWFSSDQLGLCFSYPQGYTQIPNSDAVEIVAPDLPGTDTKGLFWLEISDSYDRSAETIADQDMTYEITNAPGLSIDRWTVTLGGEQAVVLDGMPGQNLQRRVYVVRQQTLYILAFWPARSENKAAGDQMEALYAAVTNSWAWSPCSASE